MRFKASKKAFPGNVQIDGINAELIKYDSENLRKSTINKVCKYVVWNEEQTPKYCSYAIIILL